MRPLLQRPARTSSWTFAVVAVGLALAGCGGSEDVPPPAATSTSAPAQPAPAADPLAEAAADQEFKPFMPFEVPIEGPIEEEEVQTKPLHATFPAPKVEERPTIPELPDDDTLLGRPLVVNGKVISFDEVKKQVCLSNFGTAELADARIEIFIQEEVQRLKDSGAPPERMELPADEFERFLSVVEENMKSEYPDGAVSMEDLYRGLGTDDPHRKLRTQMLFSKLFMPEDPDHFPPLSKEAVLKHEGGQSILDYYKALYEQKKQAGTSSIDEEDSQFNEVVMQQIVQHLNEVATIVRDPEPSVLFRVNGVDIKTEDIWNRIKSRVTVMEVLAAKQWIVKTRLVQAGLEKAGAWLSDEEASAAYFAYVDPHRDSLFNLERVALAIKGFPSVEYFKHYRRLYDSFLRFKKPTPEELEKHANYRTRKVVGQVAVDVDVILCSAFEFKSNSWKANGWVEAENRMKDVLRLLIEEQRPWEELVERYSDFYEPPVPASQRDFAEPPADRKGQYRNVQRNSLIQKLSENEFRSFLTGHTLTDFVFFDQEVGTLGDPMIGPYGWYLPKLLRRTKTPKRIPMDEEVMNTLIFDDYMTCQLHAYAEEQVKTNQVYGLELPGTLSK